MLSLNAQSVVNKIEKLHDTLLVYDPHVCVICETWLHDGVRDDEIVSPNHQLFRKDRCSRGGGVAVIPKNSVDVRELDQIDNHESLFLSVTVRGVQFILRSVYRTPNADDQYMQELYDHILKFKGKNLIITGDFNLPQIDWYH